MNRLYIVYHGKTIYFQLKIKHLQISLVKTLQVMPVPEIVIVGLNVHKGGFGWILLALDYGYPVVSHGSHVVITHHKKLKDIT